MDELRRILLRHWGYENFRPLQAEAMGSVLAGRDSVVVLPTGGGKSLCYQAPALARPGLAVVVSPLISLMKDQVDALADRGVPAACVNSTLTAVERRRVAEEIRSGRLKLLYLSPERLMTEKTLSFLKEAPLSFFAIDEAHCISDWGHDFRPEYRMLSRLKESFPGVAVHGYTATATERVRQDIARELRLERPSVLVGSFDRPNLIYRVQRRGDLMRQIQEVLARHQGEAGIIYCIRRKDVEEICGNLRAMGHAALPYHAGLSDDDRKRNQDAFIKDQARLIVATVAFGMGIDKSDVRFVLHAAAPKSLEHYQQESGRAGRDGLEAECCLFSNGADFAVWRKIQSDLPGEAYDAAMQALRGIEDFCASLSCRRQSILRHFGQEPPAENCGACDICLGEAEPVAEALVVSQKILSCVLRLKEKFGGDYTSQVLLGSREQRILENRHDQLSTYGLLREAPKQAIRSWIEQLVSQGFLEKEGEYNLLKVTAAGRRLLKGELTPRLLRPAEKPKKEARIAKTSWEGVDRALFESLRALRRELAEKQKLPPYIIFSDATLRELARRRPSTVASFRTVSGVGEKKSAEYGAKFLGRIADHCREQGLKQDVLPAVGNVEPGQEAALSLAKRQAFALFARGQSIEAVAVATGRAFSTAAGYLCEFLEREAVCDPTPWVDAATAERVRAERDRQPDRRLRPIYEGLGETVPYEAIRIVLLCLRHAEEAAE